jgi:hypothetical protein
MKKPGPKPLNGSPAVITVAAKLNAPEMKAVAAAMRAKGIPSRSRFISQAVRAYVALCGVQLPDDDPAQLPLPLSLKRR